MKKNIHTSNQHVLSDEWFEKAYDDIRAAEVLLAHKEGPMNIVCFHAQQSAEKYL